MNYEVLNQIEKQVKAINDPFYNHCLLDIKESVIRNINYICKTMEKYHVQNANEMIKLRSDLFSPKIETNEKTDNSIVADYPPPNSSVSSHFCGDD
jgi:hypothetical protein